MKKASLSLALCAAITVAMAATPSYAAAKKSSKPMKVTVTKNPLMVSHFHACVGSGTQFWGRIPLIGLIAGPVSAIGCGLVYSGPVLVETFVLRRA